MQINSKIITLYKYFAYASHMRALFRKEINEDFFKMFTPENFPLFLCSPPGIYLMYSYSGIYLVIEGWKDEKLVDQKIDELIKSPFVDKLRLFRNATFHYQSEPISWKHLQFFGSEEERTEIWLNNIYSEFERFFSDNIQLPTDLIESLKGKSAAEVIKITEDYLLSKKSSANSDSFDGK